MASTILAPVAAQPHCPCCQQPTVSGEVCIDCERELLAQDAAAEAELEAAS